ncbi:MAG: HEPN domain-containing protein [Clostridia bacterium]|nr:HEPN domain-containing protein [Clostridia bacterium]MDR3645666.1 HEPN domain-containing protein [Clostridia bacterium]
MRWHHEGDSDSKRYLDWLDCAGDDLKAATLLLSDSETLNSAAFHCQQCIEKALKGYILFKTRNHVDGHNLTWLCRQAIQLDPHFREWLDESTELNRFYIETRYPSDIPLELSDAYVRRIRLMAENMYKFILQEVS